MLSRFYLTGGFKAVTLLTLVMFMSSLWVGCSDTKVTNARESDDNLLTGSLERTTPDSNFNSIIASHSGEFGGPAPAAPIAVDQGNTSEPPPPPYLVTEGPELDGLLSQALGNASVIAAKSYLQSSGFSYSPWYALGAVDGEAGKEVVYLPFSSGPNTTAYLIYAREQGTTGAAIGYIKLSDYSPENGYEYWTSFQADDGSTKRVWIKAEQGSAIGNSVSWVQTDCNSQYWRCFLAGSLVGCDLGALGCLTFGPATLACAGIRCAYSMLGTSLLCGIRTGNGCR